MAAVPTSSATLSISGAKRSKKYAVQSEKLKFFGGCNSRLFCHNNSKHLKQHSVVSVRAKSSDGSGGGGGDFVAGFVLGGALFGTLAYIFAPQIRRSLLNEDEYGFRKAKRPIYYDDGLEKTRHTLNAKISQLNSAIDNVSSRLRGGTNVVDEPTEDDAELEATM